MTSPSSLPPGPSRWQRRRGDIGRLALRRLGIAIPLILLVSVGVFALAAVSPFDPLVAYLGPEYQNASPVQRQQMSAALGYDVPWHQAWRTWLAGVVSGDLGFSRVFSQPVTEVIAERLPWTLLLAATGLLIAALFSIVLGVRAGVRPGGLADRFATGLAVTLQGLPSFVLALGSITVFALLLRLLPTGGLAPPGAPVTVGTVVRHLALPALVLGISQMPWFVLSVRNAIRDALSSDAVFGARARGLSPRTVVGKHIVPVSMAPLATLLGARLPELVVGSVLVEEVFSWPGVASAVVDSATELDFPLMAALTLGTTAIVLFGTLLADIAYLLLDPRVTYE